MNQWVKWTNPDPAVGWLVGWERVLVEDVSGFLRRLGMDPQRMMRERAVGRRDTLIHEGYHPRLQIPLAGHFRSLGL